MKWKFFGTVIDAILAIAEYNKLEKKTKNNY